LISLIEKKTISNNIGKQIIVDMMKDGTSASKIVEEKGLSQITDVNAIRKIVEEVVNNSPAQVEQYKSGKTNIFGYFVGQVMKATKGKANPQSVNEILKELLG
jgi:aspartyl-tRNA(Asn)/glutamyl-tRNA(Gln) amidotransferase subunit B